MASEARALLDEQIAALNDLKGTAQCAYMSVSVIPRIARERGAECLASHRAYLAVEIREKLNEKLERAEHWLICARAVEVPGHFHAIAPSACSGALSLLLELAMITAKAAETGQYLPNDSGSLAKNLSETWKESGLPGWVSALCPDALTDMAQRVHEEVLTSIDALTKRFTDAAAHSTGSRTISGEEDAIAKVSDNPKLVAAIDFIRIQGPVKGALIAKHIGVKLPTFRSHYVKKLRKLGVVNTDDAYIVVPTKPTSRDA